MSRSIALIGMMGAGKSTVGRRLGDALGRRCVDSDEEIVAFTGCTIPELFAQRGEPGFRAVEAQVVRELARYDDLVLSLGGGAVLSDHNVADLLVTTALVYLDVPAEVLVARLTATDDGRPLLDHDDRAEAIRRLHATRRDRYLAVADVTIDGEQEVDDVVAAVLDWAMDAGDVLTPSEHELLLP